MEEVAARATQFYEQGIRQKVEHSDNMGQMIVIDAETGEYGIDTNRYISQFHTLKSWRCPPYGRLAASGIEAFMACRHSSNDTRSLESPKAKSFWLFEILVI